jgi:hypothetical protein
MHFLFYLALIGILAIAYTLLFRDLNHLDFRAFVSLILKDLGPLNFAKFKGPFLIQRKDRWWVFAFITDIYKNLK